MSIWDLRHYIESRIAWWVPFVILFVVIILMIITWIGARFNQ